MSDLSRFQNVPRQRHVKRIRRADQQMKPDQITPPVPNQMAEREHSNDQGRVKREKIRRQRNQEIAFGDDNMAAAGGNLDFFHLAAKEPGPQRRVSIHGQRHKSTSVWAAAEKSRASTPHPPAAAPKPCPRSPLAQSTFHKAIAAPAQTGSSRMAMKNLIHFSTQPEFRIRKLEARRNTRTPHPSLRATLSPPSGRGQGRGRNTACEQPCAF